MVSPQASGSPTKGTRQEIAVKVLLLCWQALSPRAPGPDAQTASFSQEHLVVFQKAKIEDSSNLDMSNSREVHDIVFKGKGLHGLFANVMDCSASNASPTACSTRAPARLVMLTSVLPVNIRFQQVCKLMLTTLSYCT